MANVTIFKNKKRSDLPEMSQAQTNSAAAAAKSLQSCPTGSPIPGILQARTLEWVAISFSNA